MSARALLNSVETMLREMMSPEDYWELVHPPTPRERKERRLAELRAVGIPIQVNNG